MNVLNEGIVTSEQISICLYSNGYFIRNMWFEDVRSIDVLMANVENNHKDPQFIFLYNNATKRRTSKHVCPISGLKHVCVKKGFIS